MLSANSSNAAAGRRQEPINWLAWLPPADAELVWGSRPATSLENDLLALRCRPRDGASAAAHSLEAIARRLNRETGN